MEPDRKLRLEQAAARGDRRAAMALRVDAFRSGTERVDPSGLARDLGLPDLALAIARAGIGTLRGLISLTDVEAAGAIRPPQAAARVMGAIATLGLRFRAPNERPLVALPEVAARRDIEAAQAAKAAQSNAIRRSQQADAQRQQGQEEVEEEEVLVVDGMGEPGDDEGDQDPLGLGEPYERPLEVQEDDEVVMDGIGVGDDDDRSVGLGEPDFTDSEDDDDGEGYFGIV